MIVKDTADSERCALCNREIPDRSVVLRKTENDHILCILCLVEIAEISLSEPQKSEPKQNERT